MDWSWISFKPDNWIVNRAELFSLEDAVFGVCTQDMGTTVSGKERVKFFM